MKCVKRVHQLSILISSHFNRSLHGTRTLLHYVISPLVSQSPLAWGAWFLFCGSMHQVKVCLTFLTRLDFWHGSFWGSLSSTYATCLCKSFTKHLGFEPNPLCFVELVNVCELEKAGGEARGWALFHWLYVVLGKLRMKFTPALKAMRKSSLREFFLSILGMSSHPTIPSTDQSINQLHTHGAKEGRTCHCGDSNTVQATISSP